MQEKKKNHFSTIVFLFGFIVLLALPNLFSGQAAAIKSTSQTPTQNPAGLSAAQRTALEKLYAQLKAGGQFSYEEIAILNRFAAGEYLSDLEAEVIISRALYDYYVAGKELTKEQESLLSRYTLFAARRPVDIMDLKLQLLNKRIAAAATAQPQAPTVAPANDQCAGAEVIPAAGPFPYFTAVTADITDATTTGDPATPSCQFCFTGQVSRSIWYRFTPSATAFYNISTCMSDGTASTVDDNVMAIYTSSTGACGGVYTQVPRACDDDSCFTEIFQSVITKIELTAGTTYFIVVWHCDTAAPLPGNTAVQLLVTRTLPAANDTCAGAIPLTLNTPVNGTTFAAPNDYQLSGTSCFTGVGQSPVTAGGRDVVYSFTAPAANTYSFRVTDFAISANLVMYATSSCPAATPGTPVNITCNSASGPAFAAANRLNTAPSGPSEELMCLPLTSGQQIFIFVDCNDTPGTFDGSPFTIEATVCTRETEANNTPATANNFGAQAFGIEGSITPAGDADFFALGSPASGSRIFAMADGVAANTSDVDMRVTTTTDTLEWDDFDADTPFGDNAPVIAGTPIPAGAGSIFLRLNHNDPAQITEPYRLYYGIQPPGANALPSCAGLTTSATPESEPNDTPATANTAANKYFSGSLPGPTPSTDVDVFSFTLSANQQVFIALDGDPCRDGTPINGKIELLGTNGTTVLSVVNSTTQTSSTTSGAGSLTSSTPFSPAEGLVYRVTASGTYYARVSIGTTSPVAIGAGDYLLSIITSPPTAVKFGKENANLTTTATAYPDGVSVKWQSGFEVENLGFNLYRDEAGTRTRVNADLIAGSALTVGAATQLAAGGSYAWFDKTPPTAATCYVIEAVDINGQSNWSTPFSVAGFNGKPALTQGRSATVEQLGSSDAPLATSARVENRATPKPLSLSTSASLNGLAGRAAAKISITGEGFYRLSQPELVAAGFDPRVNPQTLQLFVDGVEQPINVVAPNGQFDASAYLEFYGTGVDSAVTDQRIYWLVDGNQPGKRLPTIVAPAIGNKGDGSFAYAVELRPRSIYFSALRNGEKENFFGPLITQTTIEQTLSIQRLNKNSAKAAVLEVGVQGVTQTAHRVQVEINGLTLGEINFNAQEAGIRRFNFPLSALKDGANSVRLTALDGSADINLLDYLRLTYQHLFVAENNRLNLRASGKQVVSIDGFTNSAIRVFDVTDANAAQEITGSLKQTSAGYAISFTVPGSGERKLMAMATSLARHPAELKINQPSAWRQPGNAANLVIFAKRALFPAFEKLKAFRETQGYQVALVDIEDVYDEFSYGNKTPGAIKGFLGYARASWKVKPDYAIFAGKASFDPKNYLGSGDLDAVPTKLIDTQLLETASDDWLADVNGDGFADLATGRLPVRDLQEATELVNKLIGYEQTAPAGVLVMADESRDGANFEAAADELKGLLQGRERVEQINRSELTEVEARAQLLAALNRGVKVAAYFGHGNRDTWHSEVLTTADVAALENTGSLSLFVNMTCLNGYFIDPQHESLSEALLKARGGAIAVWASSGMTSPSDQAVAHLTCFNQLFNQADAVTFGEAVRRAKALTLNSDVRRTWILFGDPLSKLGR